jgi:hypothetical protein
VRIGITSYEHRKLRQILQRYPPDTSLASTVALIMRSLDEVLNLGKHEGGNVIISWDTEIWGYIPWSPER